MEERIYRYPLGNLVGDYSRAAAGLLCTIAPALMVSLGSVTRAALAVLALLFLSFALRTLYRQRMRVRVSDRAISGRPGAAPLCWGELTSVRLAFYSTRRDRQRGWMQLTLHAGRRALCVDSYIDGFGDIARRAAVAAGTNRLSLNPASRANFQSLGISLSSESPYRVGNRRE